MSSFRDGADLARTEFCVCLDSGYAARDWSHTVNIDNGRIDELLKQFRTPEEIPGKDGLIKQLTKAVLERALEASSPTTSG
jgi:hypothetical protein